MNSWGCEPYGVGMPMNAMMHAGMMMENMNVPPMNSPPPVPLPLMGPPIPHLMQSEIDQFFNEKLLFFEAQYSCGDTALGKRF
ncbi:jg4247 [Pararge aegeria aegeria]|uniref:Jg4247 protein n=1 Tax=Pararge aegeria aegeria TaxID=348720 RepID=A0A8S4QKX8_9NEOP|nr:jg4247 [Pararge aegeria aegeria]